ncbi:hypothetical protein BAUCODRAFT_37713 [Baudoinia panamericana UAMH 10762]|uniref:Peroxisomal membrane protein PEX14 n=1 Tax=Baudoinia panamericana (strain UAMH 10762) TaxID=717646 RepID=M2M8R3_BAUPA|nr:uncharacterized protein BAUCODRAFT_37713 [Baudoinia panamericana UAMH 10762]EMC92796.1 hypothetical protein BAUCODRAFT_37713 [Baudoinia panamericana UAMH 10762]
MAIREELIEGAVTFLQDPSVSTAPIEQKIAFLRSKNLTQEEIDASLARTSQVSATSTSQPPPSAYNTQQYRPQYGYQQPPSYWNQPPPELPRRDWRDWFIMATVVGGAGYAMYWTAKRYVYPLIAPPTPPQLEADKASIDTAFDKAFALLDQLATDTQALKDSEKSRTERLDQALSEVEAVLSKMKEANEARELEARSMARELLEVKDQIPKAIEREKKGTEEKLESLVGEMRSLKTLVANRMQQPSTQHQSYSGLSRGQQRPSSGVNGVDGSSSSPAPETNGHADGANSSDGEKANAASPSTLPDRSGTNSPFGRMLGGGKAQIPAWQLAAKKRNEEAKAESGAETPHEATVEEVAASS